MVSSDEIVMQEATLTGSVSQTVRKLTGTIEPVSVNLTGKINLNMPVLIGRVLISTDYDNFNGDYEVTPKINSQTIETKNKLMYEDLIVKSIPYYEVSNTQGRVTIIIGGE